MAVGYRKDPKNVFTKMKGGVWYAEMVGEGSIGNDIQGTID